MKNKNFREQRPQQSQEPISVSFYYGWIIVALSGLAFFFSGPGQTYSISVFINYYIESFGWSHSLVSGLYSGATLISGLTLSRVGRLIDIYGHRRMATVVAIVFALVCLWMSFVVNPLMLVIGFFFLRLSGQGSMSMLGQTLPPLWFEKRRGFALSLTVLGGILGAAAIPLINNYLIQNYSAPLAWRFWALMLSVVMATTGWFLIRDKPEDIGEKIDGRAYRQKFAEAQENGNEGLFSTPSVEVSPVSWTLEEARRTRAYWLMLYCAGMNAMVGTGITFHLVSIIMEKGHTPGLAAVLLGFRPLLQFPFSLLAGRIFDRFPLHLVKAGNYILMTLAIVLLMVTRHTGTLFLYAGIYGIFMGFEFISNAVVWPNYFGKEHLGSIRGSAMTAMVIGSALGPLPFGLAFDLTGSFSLILGLTLIFPLLAMLASYLAPRPVHPREESQ